MATDVRWLLRCPGLRGTRTLVARSVISAAVQLDGIAGKVAQGVSPAGTIATDCVDINAIVGNSFAGTAVITWDVLRMTTAAAAGRVFFHFRVCFL